jgi:hypothetical protein
VKCVNFFVVFACGQITCLCPLSGMWHAVEFRCITASAFHAQVSVLTCGSPACYVSQVIKKPGESLADSFLEEGFVLDKVNYSLHELACADSEMPLYSPKPLRSPYGPCDRYYSVACRKCALAAPLSRVSIEPCLTLPSPPPVATVSQSFGIGQPRRIENAKIMIANTPMDTDKIKIYGSRVGSACDRTVSVLVVSYLAYLLCCRLQYSSQHVASRSVFQ